MKKKKKQHWGFINHQGSIPDGWSRMAKEKKKKMKGSRGRKRSNQMKGWRRNGCGAGKMARYRRAHFLCRPIRHAAAGNGGGRMDGGAGGSGVGWGGRGGRGGGGGGRGVMNSWPIPSRMPSNLCYKEGHPSSGQAAALYTAARTRKHAARMPDSHSHKRAQWSQPGAPVHHPENSITPSSVEGCSATPLLGAGKGAVVHCCSPIWVVSLFFFIQGRDFVLTGQLCFLLLHFLFQCIIVI